MTEQKPARRHRSEYWCRRCENYHKPGWHETVEQKLKRIEQERKRQEGAK